MRHRARVLQALLLGIVLACGLASPVSAQTQYSLYGLGQQLYGYDTPVLSLWLSAQQINFGSTSVLWGSVRFIALGGPYGMYLSAGLQSAEYSSPSPGVHKAILTTAPYWHADYRNWIPGYSDTIVRYNAIAVIEVTTYQLRPGTVRGGLVHVGFRIYDITSGSPVLTLQSTQPPPPGSPYAIGDPNLPYYELEPFTPGGYMIVQFP